MYIYIYKTYNDTFLEFTNISFIILYIHFFTLNLILKLLIYFASNRGFNIYFISNNIISLLNTVLNTVLNIVLNIVLIIV